MVSYRHLVDYIKIKSEKVPICSEKLLLFLQDLVFNYETFCGLDADV